MKREKINHLSMNLLVSYLSIVAVPLLAIVVIYFTASDLLMSMQREKMHATLHLTAVDVSRSVEEAANLAGYISNSKELDKLCSDPDSSRQFYAVYEYAQGLSTFHSLNSAIDGVYFFFRNGEYLIRDRVAVPAGEQGYRSLNKFSRQSYEELQDIFANRYFKGELLNIPLADTAASEIVVLQSFPYSSYEDPAGTLAVVIDRNFVQQRLRENLIHDQGAALMVRRDGTGFCVMKAVSGADSSIETADIPAEKILLQKPEQIQIHAQNYVVSVVEDIDFPYSYICVLPKKVVLGQIGYIKYLIVALCLCSVFMGLGVCVGMWSRRRNVVLAFARYNDEFGTAQTGGRKLRSFWDGIPYLLDSLVNLQNTMMLQKLFMQSAVVRKLLTGEYGSAAELDEQLHSADITLEGNGYYVAVVSLNDAGQTAGNVDRWSGHRLYIKQYFEEQVPASHHLCELNPLRTAVILPVKTEESLHTIRELLQTLSRRVLEERHTRIYIGIGRWVTDRLETATSCDDAVKVTEYLIFHDIRFVMQKDEMPRHSDSFFFPIETELHMVKAIRQGNQTELEDIFRILSYENFTYRKLSKTMIDHLFHLVRATVVRVLREDAMNLIQAADMVEEAGNLEEICDVLYAALPGIATSLEQKQEKGDNELKTALVQLLEENYPDPCLTLGWVSDRLHIPENKLYKQFKQLFAMSFSEYLENRRILKACELLKEGMPVKNVAEATGYGSDFSFRRAFKRLMGLAPSYYAEGFIERKHSDQ